MNERAYDFRTTFREAMLASRQALGLTQVAFSVRCGVSFGTVRNIEQGVQEPSLVVALRIATHAGFSLDALSIVPKEGRRAAAA